MAWIAPAQAEGVVNVNVNINVNHGRRSAKRLLRLIEI
jgi:hypothetical protein